MSNYLTNFSAAAQAYVVSRTGDDCTRSKWDTARQAFDAGFVKRLYTPGPELIEYTDPRAVAGAKIRLVRDYTLAEHPLPGVGELSVGFITKGLAKEHKMYLIAEAPNPDGDVLEALMRADCFREELPVYADRLSFMRKSGLKVELAT